MKGNQRWPFWEGAIWWPEGRHAIILAEGWEIQAEGTANAFPLVSGVCVTSSGVSETPNHPTSQNQMLQHLLWQTSLPGLCPSSAALLNSSSGVFSSHLQGSCSFCLFVVLLELYNQVVWAEILSLTLNTCIMLVKLVNLFGFPHL